MSRPTYLLLIGRYAVCYAGSVTIAMDVAEVWMHQPAVRHAMLHEGTTNVVPLMTILEDDAEPVLRTIVWTEEYNGWTAGSFDTTPLRIETLHLGAQDDDAWPTGPWH